MQQMDFTDFFKKHMSTNLTSRHDISMFSQEVDELAFAFVTPLSTEDNADPILALRAPVLDLAAIGHVCPSTHDLKLNCVFSF